MYILGKEKQQKVLKVLEFVSKSEGGWGQRYRDPLSGQEWISFQAHSEYHGGGIRVLRHDPPPAVIDNWLDLCFGSDSEDDFRGLGLELSNQFESWLQVIEWLEGNCSQFPQERVIGFIKQLGVLHPMNHRDPLRKSPIEVEADYHHFVELANRANYLIGLF